MLHPYKEAARLRVSRPANIVKSRPGRELIVLLADINRWLGDEKPAVQGSCQGKSLYVLYRRAAFLIDDFWELFGLALANVGCTWPIHVYGTAPNQETVRLSAVREGDSAELIQESISGESAEALTMLCLQIDCADSDTVRELVHFLSVMDWERHIAALNWQEADFVRGQGLLLEGYSRGFFCYAGFSPEATAGDCLLALSFVQKITLWSAFLREGLEPVEFEWVADGMAREELADRMEWELALREAMEQLHFRIVNEEKTFRIYDGAGRRVYYGADGRRAAEWVLLKILFPLNYT